MLSGFGAGGGGSATFNTITALMLEPVHRFIS
jgi:hypothetical protein